MEKLRIKIHPLFLLFGVLCLFFGLGLIFVQYLISILLHEFGHAFVAKKLGYRLNNVSFLPFGAELNINQKFYKSHEIWIAIAGPLVNIILIVLAMAIWWIFPTTYYFFYDFVYINAVICIFNLLPIYPLDGGRVLLGILSKKKCREKAEKFVYILSLILSSVFFIFFFITIFFEPNFNMGIISIFLMTSSLNFNKKAVYQRTYSYRDYDLLLKKGMEVKIVAINENTPLYKLPKFLDENHYSIILVFDNNNKITKVIFEQNIESILLHNNSNDTLKTIH